MTTPPDSVDTGRPMWAVQVWVDDLNVFAQVPNANGGAAFVVKYDNTPSGLHEALNMLRNVHKRAGSPKGPESNVRRVQPTEGQKMDALGRLAAAGLVRKRG